MNDLLDTLAGAAGHPPPPAQTRRWIANAGDRCDRQQVEPVADACDVDPPAKPTLDPAIRVEPPRSAPIDGDHQPSALTQQQAAHMMARS